jgi:hypothetical protein
MKKPQNETLLQRTSNIVAKKVKHCCNKERETLLQRTSNIVAKKVKHCCNKERETLLQITFYLGQAN